MLYILRGCVVSTCQNLGLSMRNLGASLKRTVIALSFLIAVTPTCFSQSISPDEYVRAVALNAGGTILAEVNLDGSLTVTETLLSKNIELNGFKPIRAFALAISPNGQFLASAENQGKIQLWNLSTGSLVRTIIQSAGVWSLVFDTKGNRLAACGHGLVAIWDVNAGTEIRKWPLNGTCMRVSFDQSSQWLAAVADDVLHVWSVDGSESLEGKTHTFMVASVAFSPDGKLVATGGQGLNDGTVQLWRVGQALSESTVGKLPNSVEALTFSPDGRTLAAGGINGMVKLWSTSNGKELQTIVAHDYIAALAFSRDGYILFAATGPNLNRRSARLAWNPQTGRRLDKSR
jgi:WD40 repeat protein